MLTMESIFINIIILGIILCFCTKNINGSNGFLLEQPKVLSYQLCQLDKDCKENSFCYNNGEEKAGRCTCLNGFVLYRNISYYECYQPKNLRESCSKNHECSFRSGPAAECIDNICQCIQGCHDVKNECFETIYLTQYCHFHQECKIQNTEEEATCLDGQCVCPLNYRPTNDLKACIWQRNIGNACATDEDCSDSIDNGICKEGICRCPTGFIGSRNSTTCLKVASKMTDPCQEYEQCSATFSNSICSNNVCACDEELFYLIDNKCMSRSRICLADEDCKKEFKTNLLECVDGKCNCKFGINGRGFCKNTSNSLHSNFNTITRGVLITQLFILSINFASF